VSEWRRAESRALCLILNLYSKYCAAAAAAWKLGHKYCNFHFTLCKLFILLPPERGGREKVLRMEKTLKKLGLSVSECAKGGN
jgi:hypothetical protein